MSRSDDYDHSASCRRELVTKIWVCDDDGEELAMGEDVAVLKLQLADRMRVRFEAAANADVERRGISSWDGESLPERVETPGGAGLSGAGGRGENRRRARLHQRRGGRGIPPRGRRAAAVARPRRPGRPICGRNFR